MLHPIYCFSLPANYMVVATHAQNRGCTTRVKAAGRHNLPEELLELLLTEPERRPRLQATSNVLNPLFIAGSQHQETGKFLVISTVLILSWPLTPISRTSRCQNGANEDSFLFSRSDERSDHVHRIWGSFLWCQAVWAGRGLREAAQVARCSAGVQAVQGLPLCELTEFATYVP